MICHHLGYPIGNEITSEKLVGWIDQRIQEKFVHWKSRMWPFHVKLKVMQSIMIPMVSYFLPLLPWSKKHIDKVSKLMRFLLWKRKDKKGIAWMAWDHICTPKWLGGAALLNLYEHMVVRRFIFLKSMFEGNQPWTEIMVFYHEKKGIKIGRTKVTTSWWNVVTCDVKHYKGIQLQTHRLDA